MKETIEIAVITAILLITMFTTIVCLASIDSMQGNQLIMQVIKK